MTEPTDKQPTDKQLAYIDTLRRKALNWYIVGGTRHGHVGSKGAYTLWVDGLRNITEYVVLYSIPAPRTREEASEVIDAMKKNLNYAKAYPEWARPILQWVKDNLAHMDAIELDDLHEMLQNREEQQ